MKNCTEQCKLYKLCTATVCDIYIYVFLFQSLVKVAHARVSQDGLAGVTELGDPPSGIITRGMLK